MAATPVGDLRGDLDAGEKKYQESLATDPNDKMSRQELDYIRRLRAKRP